MIKRAVSIYGLGCIEGQIKQPFLTLVSAVVQVALVTIMPRTNVSRDPPV